MDNMQNIAGNLWTVGKTVTTFVAIQGVSMVQSGVNTIQTWKTGEEDEILSPDEEIHKILMMYNPGELSANAEQYLMKLRTEILDISAQYDDDIRVHLYISRNSHTFGNGKHYIVINITDSDIDVRMKPNLGTPTKRTPSRKEPSSVSKLANSTRNVMKCVKSLNFL